jgi:acyl-coenzyme A synthetase/AMP-(fatty) acid ligase
MPRMNDALANLPIASGRLWSEPPSSSHEFVRAGVTYADVYSLAARLANGLAEHDAPVCLVSESRAFIGAAVLAAVWSGRSLLLPHAASARALEPIALGTNTTASMTDSDVELPANWRRVRPRGAGGALPAPEIRCRLDEPFLYLFTGGTTGQPKIWPKTPLNLLGEAQFLAHRFGVTAADVIVSAVPPYHIYGLLFSVLLPLVTGAGVLYGDRAFPQEIVRGVEQEGATVLIAAPIHYKALAQSSPAAHTCRLAFSSAGALEQPAAAAFHRNFGSPVNEVYGSTETGGVAMRQRRDDAPAWQPFPFVEWKITDSRLCLKSPLASPGLPTDDAGFVLTGDRARAGEGGSFEILGRIDDVVKVSGKRVDLQEVLERLRGLPTVRDAHVASLPAATRETMVVALVVTSDDEAALLQRCREVLEPAAVPRRVIRVAEIPRLPNGKIDRDAVQRLLGEADARTQN